MDFRPHEISRIDPKATDIKCSVPCRDMYFYLRPFLPVDVQCTKTTARRPRLRRRGPLYESDDRVTVSSGITYTGVSSQRICRLCLLEVGWSTARKEYRGRRKDIQQCETEREREVGFLYHRGRCHSGANAPTGGTTAGHLTCRTAPNEVCAFLGKLRAPAHYAHKTRGPSR